MIRFQRIVQVLIAAGIAGGVCHSPINAEPAPPAGAALAEIVYKPPAGAGEKNRVNGSKLRSGNLPPLFVIGSEHTGLTTQEQPSLFYFLDQPATHSKMVLSVLQELKPAALLEVELDPGKAGVQRFDLSKTACKLESGKVYQWVIAIIPESGQNEASSASIKRVDASASLIDQLQPLGSTLDRAVVYARNGIWYDAFGSISDQIDADGGNPRLRALRAKLCVQVNLPEVARFENQAAEGVQK